MNASPQVRSIQRRDVPRHSLDGLPPVLARIYAARGVTSLGQLNAGLGQLASPEKLLGIKEAVTILHDALDADARILLVGDFDADGATSCAVGVLALRSMGARHVDYIVPNRSEFGYGLTPEIVGVAACREPDLIVTVDNGIASVDGVAVAQELGMSVLVTDHHLPAKMLPTADAIVNPNQPGDRFPGKNLAGVGVIFYVMLALRQRLRAQGWFEQRGVSEPNLAHLLDLVALGTVADLVPLDQTNRILVRQGLARINAGHCRPGILALLERAGRWPGRLSARDLGFALAPRLNAAGRLDDMSYGIECLLREDEAEAAGLAARLDELNLQRREIQADMQEQAQQAVTAITLNQELPFGVCLCDEAWHPGIVGLIASRMKERLHRPVIAFAPDQSGELKGSARSIEGLHIRDLLDTVATQHPGLLRKFGGHAMAAGLSLPRDSYETFREAFDRQVRAALDGNEPFQVVYTDDTLEEKDLSLDLAEQLLDGGPWGQHFPEPAFDNRFDVVDSRVVGDGHLKMRVRMSGGSRILDAISFRHLEQYGESCRAGGVRMVYRLEVNEFNGRRSAQLVVEHLEQHGAA